MQHLEESKNWAQIIKLKDTMALRELAERFEVSVGALSAALRRTNTSRTTAREALPPEKGTGTTARTTDSDGLKLRPGSKDHVLAEMRDQLGRVPDSEIARRAGVSLRTVASFRTRNDIPGYKRESAATSGARPRPSRIDAHRHLVGKVQDREVAEKANVSLSAVRAYRRKHGIPSAPQAQAAGAVPSQALTRSDSTAVAVVTGGTTVWRVTMVERGSEISGFVLGDSLVDVARKAEPREVIRAERMGSLLA